MNDQVHHSVRRMYREIVGERAGTQRQAFQLASSLILEAVPHLDNASAQRIVAIMIATEPAEPIPSLTALLNPLPSPVYWDQRRGRQEPEKPHRHWTNFPAQHVPVKQKLTRISSPGFPEQLREGRRQSINT